MERPPPPHQAADPPAGRGNRRRKSKAAARSNPSRSSSTAVRKPERWARPVPCRRLSTARKSTRTPSAPLASVADGTTADGAPGVITQADLLTAIAPVLTARGDTFRIRAYGEAGPAERAQGDRLVRGGRPARSRVSGRHRQAMGHSHQTHQHPLRQAL